MRLVLPLPPSLNEMIDLAKMRDRRGKPTVYSQEKRNYGFRCDVMTRLVKVFPPREPFTKWSIEEASFYLHGFRDPVELLAGLKWPVDWLVNRGFVKNDDAKSLVATPYPYQEIDRKRLRLEIQFTGWSGEE